MPPATILLADDDASFRRVVQFNLEQRGYQLQLANNGEEAWEAFEKQQPDLLITDVKMPRMDGLELLDRVRRRSRLPTIVITAFGSVETAVDAMKRGATDFVTKPFDREELFAAVDRCLELSQKLRAEDEPAPENEAPASAPTARRSAKTSTGIVGKSPAMREILNMVERLGKSDVTVLLLGESGTGKEVVARAIHEAGNRRRSGRFVAVNSSAIPRDLLESELFGHVKGSFTGAVSDREGKFEQADGGTLFLDEIGDMPLELQAKMLRALQEREIERVGGDGKPRKVDVRVVAATHQDLEKRIAEGAFRQDLYYRLAVVKVRLPALRERTDDIPALAAHLLTRHAPGESLTITPEAIERMRQYHWPGNVRELENALQRAIALRHNPDRLDDIDFPEIGPGQSGIPTAVANPIGATSTPAPMPIGAWSPEGLFTIPPGGIILDEVEAKLIRTAMRQTGNNQTRAAELLGISRQTLIYRLQKYGINKSSDEQADASTTDRHKAGDDA